jgi:hypothetical protein
MTVNLLYDVDYLAASAQANGAPDASLVAVEGIPLQNPEGMIGAR